MRVKDLKALLKECKLKRYSKLRKEELITLLQRCPRPPKPTRPPPPPPLPRQPTAQEMDIFEQQEMDRSRPQVKDKLKGWYDWLVDHVIPIPLRLQ